MIILKKIQLNNFLSHGKTVLDFHENQKLLIDGKSGSGKSGIVEGLVWCLYGKSRVENNRHLIKYGKPAASVEVILEETIVDKNEVHVHKILRHITKGGRHVISLELDDKPVTTAGIKASQEYIENEILHSSYILFINSIAYLQDNIENFVKQPADKRKDIILEIVHADAYDKYYERVREEITDRQNETVISAEKVTFLKNDLETAKNACEGLQEDVKGVNELTLDIEKGEKQATKLGDRISELDKAKQSTETIKAENLRWNDGIEVFRTSNGTASDKLIEIEGIDVEALKAKSDTIPTVEAKIKELETLEQNAADWDTKYIEVVRDLPVRQDFEALIKDLNKQLITIMEETIEDCPELDKPCPILTEKQKERTDQLEAKLKEYDTKKEEQEMVIAAHEAKLSGLGAKPMTDRDGLKKLRNDLHDLFQVKTQYEKYSDKEKVKKEIQDLLANNDEQIIKYTELINKNIAKLDEILKSLGEYDTIKQELADLNSNLATMKNDLLLLKVDVTNKLNAKRKVEEVTKSIAELETGNKDIIEELESLQLLKEAFSPRGVKAIVVDYVIPRLEDKINEILGKLSDFSVRLDTQRSGVKGDTTIEGLFITIVNELGEEFDYNNYSGGEKLKITVAITEALAEIQQISFRILDELFVGLDEDSTESFASVMETLNNRFSQMICVTHLRNIKEMFPEKITMTKVHGTTKIL